MSSEPATFAQMSGDPELFRSQLVIDHDGRPVPFKPAPFQQDCFTALDPAWLAVAGRGPVGPVDGPVIRRAWIERGRGASKTADLAVAVSWCLAFAAGPVKGVAAAGDKDQASLLRGAIDTLVRLNPWLAALLSVQTDKVVNIKSGAELVIISSDVATSFGLLPDFLIADEIGNWPDRGEKLWQSLFSAVGKRGNALLIVATNAGFQESWQWPIRETIRQDPAWLFRPLEGFAPWISAERIEEQRRLLPPLVFDRLWVSKWSSGAGDAIQPKDLDAALVLDGPTLQPEDGYDYFCGLDLGIRRDHTGLALLGKRRGDGRLKLCQIRAWKPPAGGKVDFRLIESACLTIHYYFHPKFLFDMWQAEQLHQRLSNSGCWIEGVSFGGKPAAEMASALVEAFSSRTIALYPDADLLADLRRLRIVEGPSGWKLAADRTAEGGHADRAIGLALAALGARRAPLWSGDSGVDLVEFIGPGHGTADSVMPHLGEEMRTWRDDRSGRVRFTGGYDDPFEGADGRVGPY